MTKRITLPLTLKPLKDLKAGGEVHHRAVLLRNDMTVHHTNDLEDKILCGR